MGKPENRTKAPARTSPRIVFVGVHEESLPPFRFLLESGEIVAGLVTLKPEIAASVSGAVDLRSMARAAGIRRLEAVTAGTALDVVQRRESQFSEIAAALKAAPEEVEHRLVQVLENVKRLEKELVRLKSKIASAQGDDLADQAVSVGSAKVLAANLEGADVKTLRETVDKLKDKLQSAVIVLGSAHNGKVSLIAGVTSNLTSTVKAGDLVNFVAGQVGGKGGGRADMAQAGGTDTDALPQALASVESWVRESLS